MRLMTVVGARPQFIKAASLSRRIGGWGGISEFIVHTGQHYDANMSQVFFDDLGIPQPDLNLGVGSGTHAEQTAAMLTGIEAALAAHPCDLLVVYGDTNSTVAGALAAAKLHVPVAHVEAGLRSFNRNMPEEINRIVTDQLAQLHFCPSRVAVKHLDDMGIRGEFVVECGDIMYESLLYYRQLAKPPGNRQPGYLLTTFHRAENTDNPERLEAIVESLCAAGNGRSVVIPLHPRARHALERAGLLSRLTASCEVIEPVGFLEMVALLDGADLVITDSGGLQKEAFFMGKPCVVLREQTEWVELVELGAAQLWLDGTNLSELVEAGLATELVKVFPYGDGDSSRIILESIQRFLDSQ